MKADDVTIKKSQINGQGVFANRDYKKGEIVLKWDTSKTLTKEEFNQLSDFEKQYVCVEKGKYVQMQSPEKFLNHSCNANTVAKNFCDVATRDIKKGEEITGNYNDASTDGLEIKCACGQPNCCRKIKL